jgi:argininosuccinate synthase
MSNRVVFPYFGDEASLQALTRAVDACDEVIAVALDLGSPVALKVLQESALAAGAVRCHALDVREEFARRVILPALRLSGGVDPTDAVRSLAREFVEREVRAIAHIERADPLAAECPALPWMSRPDRYQTMGPAWVSISFADGMPTALNDVAMSLAELMESLETITGVAAFDVLQLACLELDQSAGGTIALLLQNGRITVEPALAVQ